MYIIYYQYYGSLLVLWFQQVSSLHLKQPFHIILDFVNSDICTHWYLNDLKLRIAMYPLHIRVNVE